MPDKIINVKAKIQIDNVPNQQYQGQDLRQGGIAKL